MQAVIEIFVSLICHCFCLSTFLVALPLKKCEKAHNHWILFKPGVLRELECTVSRGKGTALFFKINLFIYLWLCWVLVSVLGLSLVAASGGHSSSRCAGLSLSRPLLLWSTGSRRADSVVVAHGPSCSAACGIFPDQGSNPCPLHWQADSQPLRHQGNPRNSILTILLTSAGQAENSSGRLWPQLAPCA